MLRVSYFSTPRRSHDSHAGDTVIIMHQHTSSSHLPALPTLPRLPQPHKHHESRTFLRLHHTCSDTWLEEDDNIVKHNNYSYRVKHALALRSHVTDFQGEDACPPPPQKLLMTHQRAQAQPNPPSEWGSEIPW